MKNILTLLIFCFLFSCAEKKKEALVQPPMKLKALIIDGQNNHYVWPKTTMMMKDYLEQTDLFTVDVKRTDSVYLGIKYNKSRPEAYNYFIETYPLTDKTYSLSEKSIKTSNFSVNFNDYDVVISNLGAESPLWPEKTRKDFEEYMKNGGGLVVIHAANNAWGEWEEFNKMIGLGAWGGRDESSGPYVYYNEAGEFIEDNSEGVCGSHGPESEFQLTTRAPQHPIMKGLPNKWLHTPDELYERMRGPFENATILATAFADVEKNAPPWDPTIKGLGQHVPQLMAINYVKGRVFHSTLGHFDYSMECTGFITTLQRGAEWAATGIVTQEIPEDFPKEDVTSSRNWK
tara:strand:- start:18192 stop:19226 length:1035 start_codon:yes stop_codon:yes gene_type:complete